MVGEDVLREPLEVFTFRCTCAVLRLSSIMFFLFYLQSFSKLKEALRVCAAFRGTYLDYREKAEVINEKNRREHEEKM